MPGSAEDWAWCGVNTCSLPDASMRKHIDDIVVLSRWGQQLLQSYIAGLKLRETVLTTPLHCDDK